MCLSLEYPVDGLQVKKGSLCGRSVRSTQSSLLPYLLGTLSAKNMYKYQMIGVEYLQLEVCSLEIRQSFLG